MADFKLSGKVEVDAQQGVAALGDTREAIDDVTASQRQLANAARSHVEVTGRADASSRRFAQAQMNLARQTQDVTQSLALGMPFFTVFGQQIGQVGDAMSQMGGRAEAIGRFIMGPWGQAITVGTVVLGGLVTKLWDTEKAGAAVAENQDQLAKMFDKSTGKIRAEVTELQKLIGLRAQRAVIDDEKGSAESRRSGLSRMLRGQNLEVSVDKFGNIQQDTRLAQLADRLDAGKISAEQAGVAVTKMLGGDSRMASFVDKFNKAADAVDRLEKAIGAAGQNMARVANGPFRSAEEIIEGVTARSDKAAGVQARYRKEVERLTAAYDASNKSKADEARLDAGTAAAQAQRNAALKAIADRQKEAADARRLANQEERDAAREARQLDQAYDQLASRYAPLTTAAGLYREELEKIAKLQATGRATAGVADEMRSGAFTAWRKQIEKKYDDAPLDQLAPGKVAAPYNIDEERADAIVREADVFGKRAGASFNREAQVFAEAIGQAIGGGAGRTLQGIVGLIQGAQTGDFTAMGGRAGGIMTLAGAMAGRGKAAPGSAQDLFSTSFRDELKKTFSPIVDKFDGQFGSNGVFAKNAGKAFAGASAGAMVSGIGNALGIKMSGTGAQVGGAIGQFIPIPGGAIIGSIAGGLLGNMLGTTKKGVSTVSASGGSVSVGAATGNSAAFRKAADAMGNSVGDAVQALVDQLGGELGDFAVSIGKRDKKFTVDTSGQGRTKGVTKYASEEEASQAALADAIRDGAVSGVSPRVQAVIQRYAENVNKAVAEALKVRGLEDLLANEDNPFSTAFRDFESQARQRVDVARKYGFDVLQIEKINGEQRAKLIQQTLDQATSSVKSVLDDLKFGGMAEGSFSTKRAALIDERDRLADLARGGDQDALNRLGAIAQQLLQLDREGVGSTGLYASDRAETTSLLETLVRQTEDRIKAAAEASQKTAEQTNAQLTEANASLDDLVGAQERAIDAIEALPASIAAAIGGAGNGGLAADYTRYQA